MWCSLLPAGSTDIRSEARAAPRGGPGAPRPLGRAYSGPPRVPWGPGPKSPRHADHCRAVSSLSALLVGDQIRFRAPGYCDCRRPLCNSRGPCPSLFLRAPPPHTHTPSWRPKSQLAFAAPSNRGGVWSLSSISYRATASHRSTALIAHLVIGWGSPWLTAHSSRPRKPQLPPPPPVGGNLLLINAQCHMHRHHICAPAGLHQLVHLPFFQGGMTTMVICYFWLRQFLWQCC